MRGYSAPLTLEVAGRESSPFVPLGCLSWAAAGRITATKTNASTSTRLRRVMATPLCAALTAIIWNVTSGPAQHGHPRRRPSPLLPHKAVRAAETTRWPLVPGPWKPFSSSYMEATGGSWHENPGQPHYGHRYSLEAP